MKVAVSNDLIILYLNKLYIQSLDFKDKETIQNYLKQLLLKLQDNYNLEFCGYYNMHLYVDKYYGVIIEIEKEELEYLDYFNNSLEINTKIIEDSFLYEITNIDEFLNNTFKIYVLNNDFYLKVNKEISILEMARIIENTNKIIYGSSKNKIIKKAKEVIA